MLKAAIITGAGSGIGAAVAHILAAKGYAVAVADRHADGAAMVQRQIEQKGLLALAIATDVTSDEQVQMLVDRTARAFGRPEAIVACAGVAMTGSVTSMPIAAFDEMMNVNAKGVYLLARAAMPHLERGGGSFTAIASDAALNGFQGYAGYCASKHAVVGLIKALALDHGPRQVRCNAICPGYVETPMLDRLMAKLPGDRSDYERAVPLGRFGRTDDVASLAAFLASEAGAYINGAVLPLDGGGTAGPFQAPSA